MFASSLMASNNSTFNIASAYSSHPNTPSTTFVQAEPSNFRDVVQRLTGAPENSSSQKMHVTFASRTTMEHHPRDSTGEMSPRRLEFKPHERRQKKLEIELNSVCGSVGSNGDHHHGFVESPSGQTGVAWQRGGFVMLSPVSTLDLFARVSSRTLCEEEEKAITEKGFYLHPSTPRVAEPPELLPLFPLHSLRENNKA